MTGERGFVALHDGDFPFDPRLLSCVRDDPGEAARRLRSRELPSTVDVPVYAFLLDLPAGPVLVDTGAGQMLGPELGKVPAALEGLGIAPEDVCAVALTHLHGDHCGGLVADGAPRYPNARLLVPQAEQDHWFGGEHSGTDEIARDARSALDPYQIELVGPGWWGHGLEAIAAPGHTPGHLAWAIPSLRALACGDIWHVGALQMDRPGCTSDWDFDKQQAIESRRALVSRATSEGWFMLCAHSGIADPAIAIG